MGCFRMSEVVVQSFTVDENKDNGSKLILIHLPQLDTAQANRSRAEVHHEPRARICIWACISDERCLRLLAEWVPSATLALALSGRSYQAAFGLAVSIHDIASCILSY